ncbi:ParB/Srx family N-terminal domain-containing protein [Aquihabitans sp. G128]|uniref:ParB/Srx family N-terminal domain-containing protein n=1 Tax=Aquihabitans sp. G128 TaxID=2849779 RepID=UPI001C23B500|nr:ParB/Srx family N-terminal domain-containing protein [Aquihabitans sp. G128]QXC59103.1 ParB/Srx family N-terminal domain-containing protein [Aquihabitans sp. G128]
MDDPQPYSTAAAREAAAHDQLAEWVGRFLSSPGSDNAPLAKLLSDPPLAWLGPVLLPLDQLNRLAGPPGHPVVEEVDDDYWRDDVEELAQAVDGGHEPAPVVVTHQGDHLKLEDGNHRVEALRRAGETEAWAVIGFEGPEERDAFIARSEATAAPEG